MMFMKENMGGFTFPHADQAEAKNDEAPDELEAFSLSAEWFSVTASLFLSSSIFGFPSGCSHLTYWEMDNMWDWDTCRLEIFSRKRSILDLWRIRWPTSTFSDLSCSPRLVEELSGLSELFLVSELVLIAVTFLSSTDDQSFLCLTNYCLVTKRLKSKCYDLFTPDEI